MSSRRPLVLAVATALLAVAVPTAAGAARSDGSQGATPAVISAAPSRFTPPATSHPAMPSRRPAAAIAARQAKAQTHAAVATAGPRNVASPPGFAGASGTIAPPDTNLAVGNHQLMESDNSSIYTYAETGGSATATATLDPVTGTPTFFDPSGADGGYYETDARVVYDAYSGRWFVSGLMFSKNGSSCASQIVLAVSKTASPSLTTPSDWNVYSILARTNDLMDQPRLGVSTDKVQLAWNDYADVVGNGNCGDAPNYDQVYGSDLEIDKAGLVSGLPFNSLHGAFIVNGDFFRFGIAPAVQIWPNLTAYSLYNNADSQLNLTPLGVATPSMGVIAVTGLAGNGTLRTSETDPSMAAAHGPDFGGTYEDQPGSPGSVDSGDDRLLGAQMQGNEIVTSFNDLCSGRPCGRVVELTVSGGPHVFQDLKTPQNHTYPAVTFNSQHDIYVVTSFMDTTHYPSVYEFSQLHGAAGLSAPTLLVAGTGTYNDGGSAPHRWGDYSGAAIDPDNARQVWMAGEYEPNVGPNSNQWGTWLSANALPAAQPSAYTMDGYGGVHPAGSAPIVGGEAYHPGWDIMRGMVIRADHQSGYTIDGFGGISPFASGGVSTPPSVVVGGYWNGWDIVRGLTLRSDGQSGFLVNAYGGVRAWGTSGSGYASTVVDTPTTWSTKRARGIVQFDDNSGYVLDESGSLVPFFVHNTTPPPNITVEGLWPAGLDVTRGVVMFPGQTTTLVQGYTLDLYGGLHPFFGGSAGVAPPVAHVEGYWNTWDIARAITFLPGATTASFQGYTLDGWGGLHPVWGGAAAAAPVPFVPDYFYGWDIARAGSAA